MNNFYDKRLKFKKEKQRELIEISIKKFGSQFKMSEFLKCSKTTIRDYKFEKSNIPKNKFMLLLKEFPELNIYNEFIEEILESNWGQVKGGKNRISKLKNKKNYLKYVRNFTGNKEQISKTSKIFIKNDLLKLLKLHNVDLLSILAICIMTDGYLEIKGNSHRISFSSSDDILTNFIQALLFELSDYMPTTYGPYKGAYNTCVTDYSLGKKLLKLSQEYKTYAKEKTKQPSLIFLSDKSYQTQLFAIRFAFTADGSISLSKQNKPNLELTCYNKELCLAWQEFLKKFGLNFKLIKRKKSREGVSGLRVYDYKNISNFYKIGGFIEGVKISRKSKRFVGIEKNDLLKYIVNKRT